MPLTTMVLNIGRLVFFGDAVDRKLFEDDIILQDYIILQDDIIVKKNITQKIRN